MSQLEHKIYLGYREGKYMYILKNKRKCIRIPSWFGTVDRHKEDL